MSTMSLHGQRVRNLLERGTILSECHWCMGTKGTAILRILWDDGTISEEPYYRVVEINEPRRPLFNTNPTDAERREYREIPYKHLHGSPDSVYLPDPPPRITSPLTLP